MSINNVQMSSPVIGPTGSTTPNQAPAPVSIPASSAGEAEQQIPRPSQSPINPMEQQANKAEAEQRDSEKNHEKVKTAVDKLNQTAMTFDRSIRFQIHDKTHETMVAVIDQATDKVIREIPSKEVLDLVAKMRDYIGLIFDKKA